MLRFPTRAAIAITALAFTFSFLAPATVTAEGTGSSQRVERALAQLHHFVGSGENGQRWDRYLLTEALTAELAQGNDADSRVVAKVLARYSGSNPGLRMPQFQAVRAALAAWQAELSQPAADDLAGLAREAAKTIKPIDAAAAAQARPRLVQAIAQLEAFLQRSGASRATGWKRFLQWDELQEQLAREEGVDGRSVLILDKFNANQNGLEMPAFANVREALENYLAISIAAADKNWNEDAAGQLEALAKQLESLAAKPASGDDAIAIGRTLELLQRTGQAPELVAAARRLYWRPNIYGSVSQRFAGIGFEEDINQVQGVRDNILGTEIFGTARMLGRSRLALINSPHSAQFQILLAGNAYSNSMGYNRGVQIHTTGVTRINAARQLRMDENGLTAWPSTAATATGTTIHSICARSRLVEKIAWKRAGQQKSEAEAIASQHAAVRVQGQLNARTNDEIASSNERFQEKFAKPLQRRGEFPRQLHFSSRTDRASVQVLQANESQLAAPTAPPDHEAEHDVSARVHESAVVNYGEAILSGYTLTDENLVKILRDDLKRDVPEELQITQDKDPWEITFARQTPVRAIFANNEVKLAIRAARFKRANQVVTEPLDISANYTIEKTPAGAKLVRQGDVEVTFLNRTRLGAAQIGLKTFIRRKFEALFKEEFISEGLVMKGRWERAGTLPLREIRSADAWVTLGWDLPKETTTTASAAH